MGIFNNKEIATAIWFVFFLCFILSKREIRKSALGLLRTLFQTKMLMLIFLMGFYTFWMVFFLYKVHYWDFSLLKDTIIWFFFAGIVMVFRILSSEANANILRKIIIDNINAIIIVEFLANTYTFPFVVELFLMPFLALIVGLEIVAKEDRKTVSVAKLMAGLRTIIFIIILTYVVIKLSSDYKNFFNLTTLRDFFLAPLLSIACSPLVYLFLLFTQYELLFIRLNLGREKSKELKKYAKIRIIKYCLLSLKKVRKFLKKHDLIYIEEKEDIDKIIKEIKNQA